MHLPHVIPFARHPLYFFTACTAARRPILGSQAAHRVLVEVWRTSAAHDGWFVGKYVLMPDHVHFFARPEAGAKDRANWCKAWKSVSSRQIVRTLGISPPVWQPDTFDHILRTTESYSAKWEYVRENPVRAGLAEIASTWPWSGEIHSLKF